MKKCSFENFACHKNEVLSSHELNALSAEEYLPGNLIPLRRKDDSPHLGFLQNSFIVCLKILLILHSTFIRKETVESDLR